jgi:hypothetical protein
MIQGTPTSSDVSPTPARSGTRRAWNYVFIALVAAAIALVVGWLLASSEDGAPIVRTTAISASCQGVAAVLANGPDPHVDPVGYAEAQVVPLRKVHAADSSLRHAIDQLSRAYERFYVEDGAAAARQGLVTAIRHMDHLCPEATAS